MGTNQRSLTITFMDGSQVSFSYPLPGANAAAKQLKIEELLKNPFIIVLGEGKLRMFPVANVRSIELLIGDEETEQIRLPAHAIRNAKLTTRG